jgi:hypothetical protein
MGILEWVPLWVVLDDRIPLYQVLFADICVGCEAISPVLEDLVFRIPRAGSTIPILGAFSVLFALLSLLVREPLFFLP